MSFFRKWVLSEVSARGIDESRDIYGDNSELLQTENEQPTVFQGQAMLCSTIANTFFENELTKNH